MSLLSRKFGGPYPAGDPHSRPLPSSVSLWCAEQKGLFSADAILIPGDMPIYQDILASVQSIRRLKRIEGIKLLLSAWDGPLAGGEAYPVMDRGLEYLQQIHKSVPRAAGGMSSSAEIDPMELCRRVAAEMELPFHMTNPLVARTFMSSLTTTPQTS